MDIVWGFDPGGNRRFGWSVCTADGGQMRCSKTGVASHSQEAIEQVLSSLPPGATVLAAGIDAPLFWDRKKGNREVDGIVRGAVADKGCPYSSGTVQQVNSLRGACLVQGVLLADALHQEFPEARITEAHPKALSWLLGKAVPSHPPSVSEHEHDACLAAFTAWSMLQKSPGWQDIYLKEPNPIRPFGTPVSYWMPL